MTVRVTGHVGAPEVVLSGRVERGAAGVAREARECGRPVGINREELRGMGGRDVRVLDLKVPGDSRLSESGSKPERKSQVI